MHLKTACSFALAFLFTASLLQAQETILLKDQTKVIYTMNTGRLNGEYTSYYANGQLKASGHYRANQCIGEWTFYTEDGEEKVVREYKSSQQFDQVYPHEPTERKAIATNAYELEKMENNCYPFASIEAGNILWSSRFWQVLPKEENPLLYENNLLFNTLKEGIEDRTVFAYHPSDEILASPLKHDQVDFKNGELLYFKTKEEAFYDKTRKVTEMRIVTLVPIVKIENDTIDLFTVYYPEIREQLGQASLQPQKSQSIAESLDDLFYLRDFYGEIYKVTNSYNKPLKAYTPSDQLQEAALRKYFEFIELTNRMVFEE